MKRSELQLAFPLFRFVSNGWYMLYLGKEIFFAELLIQTARISLSIHRIYCLRDNVFSFATLSFATLPFLFQNVNLHVSSVKMVYFVRNILLQLKVKCFTVYYEPKD
jgi:hypothetical protein